MDKVPLPPIQSQQSQTVQASSNYSRTDSPQPFISSSTRPKTGHPSNNNFKGSPGAFARRRLPKLASVGVVPVGAPPLYIGSTNNNQTLSKVGEEDMNEIGSFPEDHPASIKDHIYDTDTIDEKDQFIQGEGETQTANEHLKGSIEMSSDSLKEDGKQFSEIDAKVENTVMEEDKSIEDEVFTIEATLEDNVEEEVRVNLVNDGDRTSNVEANEDTKRSNCDDEDDKKFQEDNQTEVHNDDYQSEYRSQYTMQAIQSEKNNVDENFLIKNQISNDGQVPNDDDDDNDVVSPHEVSREASAQSARSEKVPSPIMVSPRGVLRLTSSTIKSPKQQNSRPTSRLSVNKSSRISSAKSVEQSVSPSKSPIIVSPKMVASPHGKTSAQRSRASSRSGITKLGTYYVHGLISFIKSL